MREYITLGATPCDEPCAQLGEPDYEEKCQGEYKRYVTLLVKLFGKPPAGASFGYKGFNHDYGCYYETVIWYDPRLPHTVDYAFRVENNLPATWDG